MSLSEEGREAIKKSNRERNLRCRKCGGEGTRHERDGGEIGGFPGLKYLVCGACGDTQPVVKSERSKRADAKREFKRAKKGE